MREAIGGTWIFSIVITFIVLFSGYLAISVNYSKAFKVKNGIINIVERNDGYTDEAKEAIKEHLLQVGYHVYSNCPDTGRNFENAEIIETETDNTGKYWYCIAKIQSTSSASQLPKVYYKITVFFKLDLPIIGNIFTFPVYGDTKTIYSPKD